MLSITSACGKVDTSERAPVRVKITHPADGNATSGSYSGTVEEEMATALSFQVPGTIEHLPVNVGQYVAAGQLIASVNTTMMQNAYDAGPNVSC